MKVLAILAVILLINSVQGELLKLSDRDKSLARECYKQEDLSSEDITKVRNRDLKNPSEQIKCFIACFFEKAGHVADGVLQESFLLQRLSPKYGEDKVQIGIERCKKVTDNNRCDFSYKLFECFLKTKKDLLF